MFLLLFITQLYFLCFFLRSINYFFRWKNSFTKQLLKTLYKKTRYYKLVFQALTASMSKDYRFGKRRSTAEPVLPTLFLGYSNKPCIYSIQNRLNQRLSNFYNPSTTYIYGKKTHVPQKNLFQLYVYILIKKVNVKYDFVYLNIFVLYQTVFQ